MDATYVAGMDVGASSDVPSGVGLVGSGEGVNAPIAATLGSSAQTSNSVLSGTDRNTPKGPPIFRWNKYSLMYNAYFGLGGFYDGTALYKSQVEKDDQFLERRATTAYRNFLRQIVDATYVPVFASGATRKTLVNDTLDEEGKRCPLWNAFLDDVDNRHHHIQDFIKKVVRHARIMGVSYIVVDNFPSTPLLQQDALKDRIYPYLYMRLPQQVESTNTKIDQFCKIEQICFREAPEKVLDPKTGQYVDEPRWKLWTRDHSVKLRKDDKTNQLIEIPGTKITYNLGEVPVISIMSSEVEDDTILPHPDFYNVAKSNWALYNIDSCQMRLIRAQMFPILCMPQTSDPDPGNKQAASPLQGFYLPSNHDGMTYPLPFYLAPPTGPYTELSATIEALREDIFRQAGQQGVQGVEKASSGVAKAYDFQAQEYVLKETAQMAKYAEEAVAEIFQKYVISEKFDYECWYEDNYSPTNVDDSVKTYKDYMDAEPGNLGRAMALEKMTRVVFNDLDDEDVQPIIDEIKANAEEAAKEPAPEPDPVQMTMMDPEGNPIEPKPETPMPLNLAPQKKIKKLPPKGAKFSLQGDKRETN
jgi:hypothetical protein